MAFLGLGLFDPMTSDEPVDLDELCPSASDFASPAAPRPPVRSRTSVDLRPRAATHGKDPIGTVRIRTRIKSSHSEGDFSSLPPEPQQGNIEYKLKLVNPTSQRLEHLVTQMKWRLREGQGENSDFRVKKEFVMCFSQIFIGCWAVLTAYLSCYAAQASKKNM